MEVAWPSLSVLAPALHLSKEDRILFIVAHIKGIVCDLGWFKSINS